MHEVQERRTFNGYYINISRGFFSLIDVNYNEVLKLQAFNSEGVFTKEVKEALTKYEIDITNKRVFTEENINRIKDIIETEVYLYGLTKNTINE